ncbi:MAG TPA: M23 family metallopeptidase [Blastocatellia bacterium]|nr:M23 family metallopeptidase [Blastocatellia bacterium]
MKHTSHRTKKERNAARKQALGLIAACLLIVFSAVALMNLETPSSAHGASSAMPVAATSKAETAAPAHPPAEDIKAKVVSINDADLSILSTRKLLIPVEGIPASQLRDSFYDGRSEGRIHQALDIMAPQNAPVLATADGVVVKLYQSARGGTMLYQSDPSGLFVYYYAHLSRYADGISEGRQLRRGDVIAFVGDTGNAGPGNFHLHFGISRMSAPGRWSGGEPIDPYPLLVHSSGTESITGR